MSKLITIWAQVIHFSEIKSNQITLPNNKYLVLYVMGLLVYKFDVIQNILSMSLFVVTIETKVITCKVFRFTGWHPDNQLDIN